MKITQVHKDNKRQFIQYGRPSYQSQPAHGA